MDPNFWFEMREEQYWSEHPEYSDFYDFFDAVHDAENCPEVEYVGTCADWELLQDRECTIYSKYNRCGKTEFICEVNFVDEYGETLEHNCAEDYQNKEWWMAAREQAYWQEMMDEWYDFYDYWDVVHGLKDKDCDLVKIQASCEDFEMTDGARCRIEAAYCRDEEYFRCIQRGRDENGE